MRFLLCGGRLKVEVVEVGDKKWEVFMFMGNGVYDVDKILKDEGFVLLMSEGGRGKVMSKVVKGDVIDYVSQISLKVAKEMRKWSR
jgi:hypothetical protein